MAEKISDIAKDYHLNHGRCAVSLAYGYWRAKGKSDEEALALAEEMKAYCGGRSPDGTCGALHAAKLLEPEHAEALAEFFKKGSQGCTLCHEIRPNAIIPCNRCVALAGEALDSLNLTTK